MRQHITPGVWQGQVEVESQAGAVEAGVIAFGVVIGIRSEKRVFVIP